MSLGSNIRRLRKARQWTQADLSERTGIKVNHLSRLEQDESDPKLSTVQKLLEALDCSPNQLLTDQQPIPTDKLDLSLVIDRLMDLPGEQTYPLMEVLERFCLGCEVANAARPDRRYQNLTVRRMTIQELEAEREAEEEGTGKG